MTLWGGIPTIGRMKDELQALEERIQRLLQASRRLADENARLRGELAAADEVRRGLELRISEARSRVESALARLPAVAADLRDAAH